MRPDPVEDTKPLRRHSDTPKPTQRIHVVPSKILSLFAGIATGLMTGDPLLIIGSKTLSLFAGTSTLGRSTNS